MIMKNLSVPALPETDTRIYFVPEEGKHSPELLFFREEDVKDSGWKRASEKGRKVWSRIREYYEHYSIDLFAPDRFVRKLAHFKGITVVLNTPIDPAVVKARLKTIVKNRSYHHLRWLVIDSLLLPLTLLAVPLPGPNVFGYYLLLRIYTHWKSYRSASRTVLDGLNIEVDARAGDVKSLLLKSGDMRTALRELRSRYGLRALQEERFIPQREVFKEMLKRFRRRFVKAS
jgi:hypothetical protein